MSPHASRIPIKAGREIADKYGYDQVVIIARKVDTPEQSGGEHVTTYGVNKVHCDVAARIGNFLKHKVMGWPQPAPKAGDPDVISAQRAITTAWAAFSDEPFPLCDHETEQLAIAALAAAREA